MSDDINATDSYQASSERLDRALARLNQAVQSLEGKTQSVAALEQQRQALASDRDRLSQELIKLRRRAEGLDQSAGEVARRLVDAMETVKTVLAK